MCAPLHCSCWRVKVCHDSSMYYTLSDSSSREQHFFGRVTTLARNRLFSENTLGRTSLPKGWNWDVCAAPPQSVRGTLKHVRTCTSVRVCARAHKHIQLHQRTWRHQSYARMSRALTSTHSAPSKSPSLPVFTSAPFRCTCTVSLECQDRTTQCRLESRHLYPLLLRSDEGLWSYHF